MLYFEGISQNIYHTENGLSHVATKEENGNICFYGNPGLWWCRQNTQTTLARMQVHTRTHTVLYHRSDMPYKQLEFQPRMYMWTITYVCVCLCVVLYKRETERDREQVSARSQTRWLNVSEYHTNMTACSPNRISTHCNTASPINSVSRRGWGFFCTGWDIKHFSSFSGL